MAKKSLENSPIRKKILDANIFIKTPKDTSSSDLLLQYLDALPTRFIDLEKIYTILSTVILEDPKGWKSINPNIQLLQSNDENETRRVSIEISKRKFQLQKALNEELMFEENDNRIEMTFRSEKVVRGSGILLKLISQSKVCQDLIWGWISDTATNVGGTLTLSDADNRINKKDFTVFEAPIVDGEMTCEKINTFSWSVLRQLARQTSHSIELENEQKGIEVQRDQFVWASNPLISEFRNSARPIILEHLEKHKKIGVTEFDLVTQVMMHLAIYEPTQVWIGNPQLINQVVDLIKNEKGNEAEKLFIGAIRSKKIRLNEELAHYESERQVIKLAKHYSTLTVTIDGETVPLPAPYMGNPELSPFKGYERTEILAKNRQYDIDPDTGEKVMIVTEKFSGKKITFKSVRPEISYLYSVGFSNLHYPRSGETNVYGAFLEGDKMPFAYSSYTPVIRGYSRDMISHSGVNPDNMMESARAWNSSWAPENTMSLLFSFAHEMMKEGRNAEITNGTHTDPLEGVFTSINPNLGFKAVSFRGVRFNVGGMKPTGFSYLRNNEGSADFMPKGEITKHLGIESNKEVEQHERFASNIIPFLPTLEMVTIFDRETEKDLLDKPIYRVTNEAFNNA